MTKEQMKTLQTLPKVLDALRALVRETDEMRGLLNRINAGPAHVMLPAGAADPVQTGPMQAVAYENAPPRKPKTLAELPAAQRRAIQGGVLSAQDPIRAAKLAQFKHDGPPGDALDAEGRSAHATQETIDTLSEAS